MILRYLVFLLIVNSTFSFGQKNELENKDKQKTSSQDFQSLTFNGIWCWFSDPRAVYYEGEFKRTYTGWVDNYGDIHVAYYDHNEKTIASQIVFDNLEIDDHNNPSLLIDKDGYLMVFFNTHSQEGKPLYLLKSNTPERIDNWSKIKELFLNDNGFYKNATNLNHTYTNPIRLSTEHDKIFLFWRGVNLKPTFATSLDNGETWRSGKILFIPDEDSSSRVPYTKVYSDGVSKIHFTFTDGHPSKESSNSLYYMYYEAGSFFKADGTKIKTIDELPIIQKDLDVVYKENANAKTVWNWDIAENENGNPIIVYAKFPDNKNHIYCYAIWKNNKWHNYDLINSGNSFLDIRVDEKASESNYSGGIAIDHESPNTLYLSVKRKDFFEIEKWTTNDEGKTWRVENITSNSTKNNVRPFAIRNAIKGQYPQLLWVQNTKYLNYSLFSTENNKTLHFNDRYQTAIKMDIKYPKINNKITKETLIKSMRELLDWQLENPSVTIKKTDYKYGLLVDSINAFYAISNEGRYKNELLNLVQYQDDEEYEMLSLENLIWHFNLGDNRVVLNKLNTLNVEDLESINSDIKIVTLSKLLTLINKDDAVKKKKLSDLYLSYLDHLLCEENNYSDYSKIFTNALSVYSIAKGINEGVIPITHRQKTIASWQFLTKQIFEKKHRDSQWNIGITGALVLASKEVYNLLD